MSKELAQVMFEAYNAEGPNPNKTWDGKDVPPWSNLGDQVTGKWRAAARASRADGVEAIAKACHEANRAYCLSLGDESQPTWESAPQWQKDSALAGVKAHLEAPRSPKESHSLWLEQKRKDGWKYGPEKNAEAKTHPCFLPYDDLPAAQKAKDFIFGAIVESLKSTLVSLP